MTDNNNAWYDLPYEERSAAEAKARKSPVMRLEIDDFGSRGGVSGYAHIRVTPQFKNPRDGELIAYDNTTDPGYYHDLEISCQADYDNLRGGNGVYAWRVCYNHLCSVELEEAEAMTKTLRTIQRKMEKMENELGRPATFGQYVARVAAAIGSKQARRYTSNQWWEGWQTGSVGDLIGWIDNQVATWQQKYGKIAA